MGRDKALLDNSFGTSLRAVLFKRLTTYQRNRKAVLNEVFVPSFFMFLGLWVASTMSASKSPSRLQTPDRLPFPQTLFVNDASSVEGDTPLPSILNNLPRNSQNEAFEVESSSLTSDSLSGFASQVFDFGTESDLFPYMYGAYYVYEANRSAQQYKFVSLVNATSRDAPGLFPQFMYEAVLRTATGDPNFKFALRSSPLPPTP